MHIAATLFVRKYIPSRRKATAGGNMVSLSQVKRREGGFSHYVIILLSEHDHKNSFCRTVIYTFSNKGIINIV